MKCLMKIRLGVLLTFLTIKAIGGNPLDSLQRIIQSANSDSIKIAAFVNLSHFFSSKPETLLGLISEAINYSEKVKDEKTKAFFLRKISAVYLTQSYFDKSIEFAIKSAALFEKIDDKEGLANSLNLIGCAYNSKGGLSKDPTLFDHSIEYHLKCIDIRYETHDIQLRNSFNNIGNAYISKGDYKKALEYFNNCYRLYVRDKDSNGITMITLNIANAYLRMALKEKNNNYFKKALVYYQELLNDFKNPKGYYQAVYKNNHSVEDRYAEVLTGIGQIYCETGNVNEGIKYLLSGLKLSEEINDNDKILNASEQLVIAFEKKGDYKLANEYLHIFNSVKDSLLNEKSRGSMEQMQALYQSTQKEHEIQKLNADKKLTAAELSKQRTQRNFFVVGFSLLILLSLFIYRSYRQKQKANRVIEAQKEEVEKQKELVDEKNKEITDSIHYAQRIQSALLAGSKLLNAALTDHFILYRPKDIVSGDFYWAQEKGDWLYLATADCTGHGVPGAFMSLLSISFLNEAINTTSFTKPNEILSYVRTRIIEALKTDGSDEGGKDGMDCVLCAYNFKTNIMLASLANNPIWVIRNSEITEIKPDKLPVGKHDFDNKEFTLHEILLKKNDVIYTFTDGYADQFGGPKGKKFKYKQLQEIIVSNSAKPMDEQKELLGQSILNWKGKLEQVDDILVIGVKI